MVELLPASHASSVATSATGSSRTAEEAPVDGPSDGLVRLQSVVVGVDGSPAGRAALAWIERQDVESIHLVHAVSPVMELLEAGFQIDVRPDLQAMEAHLDDLASGTRRFVDRVDHRIVEDSVTNALLHTAQGCDADAIVIGAHGRDGHGTLVGANVGQVIHASDLPVVLVPEAAPTSAARPRRVVVGVEDHGQVEPLLDWVAAHVDGDVSIEVVEALPPTVLAIPDAPELAAEIERQLRRRLDDALPDGFDGTAGVVFEHPVEAFAAASEDCSLLVLASRRHRRLRGFLAGSVAHHLPTVASCPVVLLPMSGS